MESICSSHKSYPTITSVARRSVTLNRIILTRSPISTVKSMTPQMLTGLLFASRIGFSGCINCIRGHAGFWSMLLRMKLAPAPLSQTEANSAVDFRSNPMFVWTLELRFARMYMVSGFSSRSTLIHGHWRSPIGEHRTVSDLASISLGFWRFLEFWGDGLEKNGQPLFCNSRNP